MSDDALSSPTPRRGFVGRMLAGVAGLAGGALLGRDLAAQQGVIPAASPATRAASDAWDMSWVDRVTGAHRMVFDSPEISDGVVLNQARTWMSGYAEVYGAKPSDMNAVVVIRHAAIPMILNDRLWDELDLGRALAASAGGQRPMSGSVLPDPATGEPARRNPFLSANMKDGARHALILPDAGLDALMERGVIVLACNLALRRPVSMVSRKEGVDAATARAKVLANLVPGVIVMPSGIFATSRAQEAGCNFLQA